MSWRTFEVRPVVHGYVLVVHNGSITSDSFAYERTADLLEKLKELLVECARDRGHGQIEEVWPLEDEEPTVPGRRLLATISNEGEP